ncbi:MAG: insulinase family protein [Sedimentisphaerales bacterium]|nr:insulinase family protein [Sedimentisphaerales bacterium]
MAQEKIDIHKLSNGLTLITEQLPEVSSAAFVFLLPCGVAYDPHERTGCANVLLELVFRGAGSYDSRALNLKMDNLGLHRNSGVSSVHCSFSGALLSDNLLEALKLHAEVFCRPRLDNDQFEYSRELALQTLDSLEDDPRQKIGLLAQEHFLPWPYNRPSPGVKDQLQRLTLNEVKDFWSHHYSPRNAIFAAAGKVDHQRLVTALEENFGYWQGQQITEPPRGKCKISKFHQPNEGAQVHIGVMYPSVNSEDKGYYAALAAVAVLSGGMGSRLFTEVREKRGLCYAIGAAHRVTGRMGAVHCYLGSTPERAQEALDVSLQEFTKLPDGITQAELDRAKVGLRASLIMQGESTSARALGCAGDFYHLGRVRTLQEIEQNIQSLTVADVVEHVQIHKPKDFTVVSIGPKDIEVNA